MQTMMASPLKDYDAADEELRRKLLAVGFTPGPITDKTRATYLRYLKKHSVPQLKKGTIEPQYNLPPHYNKLLCLYCYYHGNCNFQ